MLGPRTKMMKFMNNLLIITGQNIYYDDWFKRSMQVIITISFGINLVLGIMQPFTEEISVTNMALFFECMGPFSQSITKVLVHKYYLKNIRNLLKEMDDKFWSHNKFGQELEDKNKKFDTMLYYSSAGLYFAMVTCVIILSIWPLTSPIRKTPFALYQFYDYDTHTVYWLTIYAIEVFSAIQGCSIVTAYDGLFLDIISRLLIELVMLGKGLEELKLDEIKSEEDENKKYEMIKDYVDHHNMLLRAFKEIKTIYSIILLNQFLASTVTLCMGLYNVSSGNGTTVLIIRGLSFTGAFLFQLSIYCIAGSMIDYQCYKISEYAFNSGWEAPCGRRLRNAVMMIIMRARETPKLRAGGIIDANLNTFGNILNFSISIYTLMSQH